MSFQLIEKDGLAWIRFDHIAAPHGFSTRRGGVSTGPYQGLNLGKMSGDDLKRVAENRRLFGDAIGFPIHQTLSMLHGNAVALVTDPGQTQEADACVTDQSHVSMSVTTADCVPIAYHDPQRNVVGLAHAGWKGTLAGVAATTVEAMVARGSRAADIRVGIGPAILRCCFEVDETVARQFGDEMAVARGSGKWDVDLHEANRRVLLGAGILPGNLLTCPMCTSCHQDLYYSYRRDRQVTGRLLTAICAS